MEEIVEEDIIFDECFVTLQNENYERGAKRLNIERIHLPNIKVADWRELNIDMSSVAMHGLMNMHQARGEVLTNYVGCQ